MSFADLTIANAAPRYAELGYAVFPLARHSKVPHCGSNGLKGATNDAGQVERLWQDEPASNIGLRTDGLLVVDVDLIDDKTKPNPWLTEDRERELLVAPNQRTWSGGRQFVFREPAGKHWRNTEGDLAPNVDTRAHGGYVVIAPSFVKNGSRSGYYQFMPGCEIELPPSHLPEPPAWLIAELDRIEAGRGKATSKPSNGPANNCSAGDTIPEGKRDSTLASMAGTMRRKGFEGAAIEAALLATNESRCKPPLSESEVKRIAASIARYEPSDPAIEHDGEEITYQRITAAELDAGDYHTEFLIEGTLVAGQPLILAGGKKCLKTNGLLDASISLATATPMLGALTVNRGCRVLVMSGESGMATIQETCRRICRAKGLELQNVPGLLFSPDLPRIGDVRHLEALERFIVGDEIEVLAIDPAYLCMDLDGREGSLFASGPQLLALSKVCERNGVTLMLCHHTKKGVVDPFAPPELEDIAWAGFQEFCRQWWLVGRRERFDPDSDGEHKLWLNVGGSAGFAALWAVDITEGKYPDPRRWEVTLSHASEAREQAVEQQQAAKAEEKGKKHQAAVEAAKARIADALRSVDGNQDTKRNIRERAGMKGAAFDDAFAALLRAGTLIDVEIERANGRKYDGFKYEFGNRS